MTTKRGMADALGAVIASGANPYAQSRDRLIAAITNPARRGRRRRDAAVGRRAG